MASTTTPLATTVPSSTAAPEQCTSPLSYAGKILLAAGAIMLLFPHSIQVVFNYVLFGRFQVEFDEVSYSVIVFYVRLFGAVAIGWSVMIIMALRPASSETIKAAERATMLSIELWFLVDSTVSLYSGYWRNVILNLGFLLPFLIAYYQSQKRFGYVSF